MDIRKKAVNETGVVELMDAADEPLLQDDNKTPVTITVYGPGSKRFADATAMKNNRMMDRLRKKGKADQTGTQALAEKAEFLTMVTATSDGLEMDGLAGDELYKAVYAEPSVGFVADQVEKYLSEWANFSKGVPKA
jgi:hypothetical protein